MSRKTIEVLRILEWANHNLKRNDEYATREFKIGIICMLEDILHATNNYAGFMFLNNDDSDTGTLGYYSRSYFYSGTMSKAASRKRQTRAGTELISGTSEALDRLTIRATN